MRGSAARYFDRIFAHTGSSSIVASSRVIDSSRGFKGEFLRKNTHVIKKGLSRKKIMARLLKRCVDLNSRNLKVGIPEVCKLIEFNGISPLLLPLPLERGQLSPPT